MDATLAGAINATEGGALDAHRTVFLSDIHLGSPDCHVHRVVDFLRQLRCEHLVLVGDIVDFWKLHRGGVWHDEHMKVLSFMLAKLRAHRTRITYLRGNHDDLMRHFTGLSIENLHLAETLTLDMAGRRYLVLHGDVFDHTVRTGWLPGTLADSAYNALLAVNRVYNWQRRRRGLEGFSIASAMKKRVSGAMKYVQQFERCMVDLAIAQGCDGVICGHIHWPANKLIDGVHYLNCGDWVENMTAICHSYDDRLTLVDRSRLQPSTAFELELTGV